MAGVIYCAGSKRFATPHCRFLIHGVTWRLPPNTQVTELREQQIQEFLGQINAVKHNIANVIAQSTGKTVEAAAADMTKAVTLTASEAKAYGLVHEISTALVPAGVELVTL